MPTYSPVIAEHFATPMRAGYLVNPARVTEVTSPVCGDHLALSIVVRNDVIADASYQARGCVGVLAIGSVICENLVGMGLQEAARLSAEDLVTWVEFVEPEHRHCCEVGAQAIAEVCADE